MSKNKRTSLKARTETIRVCLMIILVIVTAGLIVGVMRGTDQRKEEIRAEVCTIEGIKLESGQKAVLWRTNTGCYCVYVGGFDGTEISVGSKSSQLIDEFISRSESESFLIGFIVFVGFIMAVCLSDAKDRTVRRIALGITTVLICFVYVIYLILRFIVLMPLGIYYNLKQPRKIHPARARA